MVKPGRIFLAWGFLALGVALAWLPLFFSSSWALIGLGLAQPLLILGWSGWRGSRDLLRPKFPLGVDAASVAGLWLLTAALLILTVAWPLEALRESGALLPALLLSLCAGCALLGLWRLWPAFAQAARQGQSFAALLIAATRSNAAEAMPGLGVALLVFVVLVLGLAIAWPGVLPSRLRLPLLLAYPLLSLLAHVGIYRSERFVFRPARRFLATRAAAAEPEPLPCDGDEETAHIPLDERIYVALRAGRVEASLQALAEGANPHALPPENDPHDQRTLPMLAALQSDLRVLRELIGRGIDLNLAHAGLTPLLAATGDCWAGRAEAVMMLLANGADARIADRCGNTPLHHAARSTDPAVAALLLDAGALLEALNADGFSALGAACQVGNWRLARFLIEHGARPEPAEGQPALLAAVSGEDDPAGVQLLLRHKARVDARGFEQRTALLQACAAGNAEIAGVLLDAGADCNAQDAHGITPLLEAAGHAHTAVVVRLAQAKPDVSAVDANQGNALVLACLAHAAPELLRQLIAMGVNVEQGNLAGRRALDIAIENRLWPQVSVLDPGYALPANVAEGSDVEKPPRARLHEALTTQQWQLAESILRLGTGFTAEVLAELLEEFALADNLIAIDWLCRQGAVADRQIDGHDCLMFHLFDRGGCGQTTLLRLLEHGSAVGGAGGLSRFLSACLSAEPICPNHEPLALALLERGADAFGAGTHTDPPLLLAIRLGWQRLLDALLAQGVDPNGRGAYGLTAAHVGAALGDENALRALIRYGALPHARACDGQTAHGIALAAGRNDLGHWLEWRGWALPGRALLPADLPAAAMAGDVEAVIRLLDLGLPIDSLDNQACSALLRAAGGGHEAIVSALIARGANVHLTARTGATALTAAISMHHERVVEGLLHAHVDPNQALPGGVTPLMLTAALGLPGIAGRLLASGASVSALDAQGMSALHCAALHAFTARDHQDVLALFDLLLLAQVAVDEPNDSGHTPFLLMLGARAEAGAVCNEDVLLPALERLLAENVAIDSQDRRGLSALHFAVMHGLPRIVERLLREGVNCQLRDSLGRSAHDLALLRGYVDIASEFAPTRSAPSLARFLRDPR